MKSGHLDPNRLSDRSEELKRFLEDRLVGQRRAIRRIVAAYERFLSPLRREDGPIIATLFAGPSGVGKTYLAKLLAEFFFGRRDALTKVECENLSQRHELSKLIGSPPGYVGYQEEALLSQQNLNRYHTDKMEELVRNDSKASKALAERNKASRKLDKYENGELEISAKEAERLQRQERDRQYEYYARWDELEDGLPRSIILFDELEKAHSTVHNFLLEVLAEGRTSLSNGDDVDLTRSFIIMTSNAGSEEIAAHLQGGGGIGFHDRREKNASVYGVAMDEIKKIFPTEFVGRIKRNVVVFRRLTEEQMKKVLNLSIQERKTHLNKKFAIRLLVTDKVKDHILEEATDHPEYGARLVGDKLDKFVFDPLSRIINSDQVSEKDGVIVDKRDGEIVFLNERIALDFYEGRTKYKRNG